MRIVALEAKLKVEIELLFLILFNFISIKKKFK